ncbi:hypothetical protein DB31_0804 [Hyalangium minutum]|uniref:Uncharacterized protein n=1 Tax=Hyalangium minutum TaxID=394096 RepID=A0A085WF68_9BACT|nr:hypothetical protein DB31_0804 [Hyalangium minutum]
MRPVGLPRLALIGTSYGGELSYLIPRRLAAATGPGGLRRAMQDAAF